MDPETQFCHNMDCSARGQVGQGTVTIHSRKEQRYRCRCCGKTFAHTTATPFYRLKQAMDVVTLVLTLLSDGCPTQAIVAAFELDERTVATWLQRSGQHVQQVHQHLLRQHPVDLGHVQADELWVKLVAGKVWQAMAMAVPSRLWLGGQISPTRDGSLITALVEQVPMAARHPAIVVCVDGLASYVTAFRKVFGRRVPQARGPPQLEHEEGLLIGQVIKRRCKHRITSVTRRVVQGSEAALLAVLMATNTGTDINTASIERLNATFGSTLAVLVRRGRASAHTQALVNALMGLVGVSYNLCWTHDSLRVRAPEDAGRKGFQRTPAMAAGLTDHCWTLAELLMYQVPPAPWVPPKRRGRPPKQPFHQPPTSTTV